MTPLHQAHVEAHREKPACCREDFDPAKHPHHAAWLTSARALVAGGAELTNIKPFDGSPVAVLTDNIAGSIIADGEKRS